MRFRERFNAEHAPYIQVFFLVGSHRQHPLDTDLYPRDVLFIKKGPAGLNQNQLMHAFGSFQRHRACRLPTEATADRDVLGVRRPRKFTPVTPPALIAQGPDQCVCGGDVNRQGRTGVAACGFHAQFPVPCRILCQLDRYRIGRDWCRCCACRNGSGSPRRCGRKC